MSLQRGDVIKVVEHGKVVIEAHPLVILLVHGTELLISNITDIENEDEVFCVLEIKDDPRILTLKSTFRYQDIRLVPITLIEGSLEKGGFKYFGKLSDVAFAKILRGVKLARFRNKEHKQLLLNSISVPARTMAVPKDSRPSFEA